MSLKWKGEVIPAGKKQKFNNQDVIQIKYNGIEVWRYDSAPPILVVSAPSSTDSSNPTLVNTDTYKVYGTVSDVDSGVASVTVNGNAATITENNWEYTLTNLSSIQGVVTTINVIATDVAGNSSTVTRYLMADLTAPSIRILSPTTVRVDSGGPITYSLLGVVTEAVSGVSSVTVNGTPVPLSSGNQFLYDMYFSSFGTYTFYVSATDNAGNTNTQSVYVTYRSYAGHSIGVNTTSILGDNGQTSATHTESFLEQGESKWVNSDVSWAGYLNVSVIPSSAHHVIVTFLGNGGSGSSRYTDFSSNIRLTDSDHERMWCNETGRWYYVTATAGVQSITYYD